MPQIAPTRSRAPLQLESLEDRHYRSATITVIAGTAGMGTLDQFLGANDGTITTADGGNTNGTVTVGALQNVGAGVNLNIAATTNINFSSSLTSINLKQEEGVEASFHTNTGDINFQSASTTLNTAGGNLTLSAGDELFASKINTSGGTLSLNAHRTLTATAAINTLGGDLYFSSGAEGAGGVLSFGNIQSASLGNLIFSATGAEGQIVQTAGSTASGLGISLHATNNVKVSALKGSSIDITSDEGSITQQSGTGIVQASSQLTLAAQRGITLNRILTPALEAINGYNEEEVGPHHSGGEGTNIDITQVASPKQVLTIVGSGVANASLGGNINITNLGSSIAVTSASPIQTAAGDITLTAQDFQINDGSFGGAVHPAAIEAAGGEGRVTLTNATAGKAFDLGTNAIGKIGLTTGELLRINANVLEIGGSNSGNINISSDILSHDFEGGYEGGWNTLNLVSGSTITETGGGALSVYNLRVDAVGNVNLNNGRGNNVVNLAARVTGLGASFAFAQEAIIGFRTDEYPDPSPDVDIILNDDLTITCVDGLNGITTNNGDVHLLADGMDIEKKISTGGEGCDDAIVTLETFTHNDEHFSFPYYSPSTINYHAPDIDLGGEGYSSGGEGLLQLSNDELNNVHAKVLRIGSEDFDGDITITEDISPNHIDELSLWTNNNGQITQQRTTSSASTAATGASRSARTKPSPCSRTTRSAGSPRTSAAKAASRSTTTTASRCTTWTA